MPCHGRTLLAISTVKKLVERSMKSTSKQQSKQNLELKK